MNVLSAVLEKIRTKKNEIILSAQDEYFRLIQAIASGKEVDSEEAANILEASGRSVEQFEKAVEVHTRRIELAEQLSRKRSLEASIPKLEREAEHARRELDAAVAKLQTKAFEADKKLRDANNEIVQFYQVESRLRESCQDPAILSRFAELSEKRLELVRMKSPLQEDLRRTQNQIRSWRNQVENFRDSLKKNRSDLPAMGSDQKGLAIAKSEVEKLDSVISQLAKAIAEIDEKLRPIECELKELDDKKLIP
jgi:chromosome segregation ATPase